MKSVRGKLPGGIASYQVTIDAGEYGTDPFVFCFSTNGTGTCIDQDNPEDPIAFTWDPSLIDGLEEDKRKSTLEQHAHMLFWDEINDQLGEERVLRPEDFLGAELSLESGSREELEEHIRRVLYLFPSIWDEDREELEIIVHAATESEGPEVSEYCELTEGADVDQTDLEAILPLIRLGFAWNDPVEWTLEYKDGASGRASGYYESAVWWTIPFPGPVFMSWLRPGRNCCALFANTTSPSKFGPSRLSRMRPARMRSPPCYTFI